MPNDKSLAIASIMPEFSDQRKYPQINCVFQKSNFKTPLISQKSSDVIVNSGHKCNILLLVHVKGLTIGYVLKQLFS